MTEYYFSDSHPGFVESHDFLFEQNISLMTCKNKHISRMDGVINILMRRYLILCLIMSSLTNDVLLMLPLPGFKSRIY